LSYICPVCNGLSTLHPECPKCKQTAADMGRFHDMLGPYSAYRPIDDMKLTNGFYDLRNHECVHIAHCSHCDYAFYSVIKELAGLE
jgi:hypothetical protein